MPSNILIQQEGMFKPPMLSKYSASQIQEVKAIILKYNIKPIAVGHRVIGMLIRKQFTKEKMK